jgi:hypothetical protein
MIHPSSFRYSRSFPLVVSALAIALVIGLVLASQAIKAAAPAAEFMGRDDTTDRAQIAEAARWTEMARPYTQPQPRLADAARWEGLAQLYRQMAVPGGADGLRWTGLAELYVQPGRVADAMRWSARAASYTQP